MQAVDLDGFELLENDVENFWAIENRDTDEHLIFCAVAVFANTNFEADPEKDMTNGCEFYL